MRWLLLFIALPLTPSLPSLSLSRSVYVNIHSQSTRSTHSFIHKWPGFLPVLGTTYTYDGDKRCLDKRQRETAWLGKLAIGYALGAGHGNWWGAGGGGRLRAVDYTMYCIMLWHCLHSAKFRYFQLLVLVKKMTKFLGKTVEKRRRDCKKIVCAAMSKSFSSFFFRCHMHVWYDVVAIVVVVVVVVVGSTWLAKNR